MKHLRNYLSKLVRAGIGFRVLLCSSIAAASSTVDTSFSSNRLDLHWDSVPGQLQQMQVSSDLVHWTNLPPVMASVFSNSAWSDDGSLTGGLFDSHQLRFYRLSLLPQTLNQSVSVPVTFLPPMAGTSYTWDFGDGTTSTSNAPTHAYPFDGTYKVVSSVTDDEGTHFSTNTILAEAPSQILLTPSVLASLRQKAASNTTQWANFKSRLDSQLNVVIGNGAYEADELQWIGDYALGYKVVEFQDPTTAAKYADKAIGIMMSAMQDFQKVGEISQQFLARGDGVTKVFTLPNTNIVASSLDVFTAPISVTTVTNKGVTDALDFCETFIKVSSTPDGNADYVQGTDWRRSGDLDNDLIDWSIAASGGHKPALNSIYYVTVASSLDVSDASPTLSGNKITFSAAPGTNQAIYVQYVYGTNASDYSTLAYQQTHANDGGFNSITIDDGYTSRYLGKFTSMGYDWLYGYAGFPATFKNQVGTMLVRWSDYWKTNGYRVDNPASNYSEGGYASRVMTALALSGGRNTNATRLVNEILSFRQTNVLPLLTSPSNSLAGGFWAEGWNYGPQAVRNLVLSGLSLETAGLISAAPERNWAGQVIPSLVAEQPTTNTIYDGGDWYDYPAPFPQKDLLYIMAAATTDTGARSNASFMIQKYSGGQLNDMQDLIFRDPSAGVAFWTNAPLERFAQGTGLIVARADWTYKSTFVSFQLGNLLDTDHQTYCQGELEIQRGADPLLINANEVGENQIPSTESAYGNTVDIDDNGAGTQVYRFNQGDWYGTPGCRILNYEATNGYVYANGDYAASYGLNTNPGHGTATTLTRQVVYERPNFVFVHDRATTKAANDPKQLRWHFLNPAVINAATNSWVATNGASKLFAQTFSRSALTTTAGPTNCNGSIVYYVTTVNSVNASNVTYVTGLQSAPSTTTAMTNTVAIYSTDGRMEGAQLGNSVVMFGADAALNPFTNSISYSVSGVSGSAPVNHLLTDLQPNRAFQVSAGGTSLGTFTSSAQGTLTFTNTPSGSQTITIQ